MTELLRGRSMIFINIPGAVMIKNSPEITGWGNTLKVNDDTYQKWKTAARVWALSSIDSKTFPLKGSCKVEVHIHYKGAKPSFTECIESVGDCFQGILWSNTEQITSWGGSKLIRDNVSPRLEMKLRW